MVAGENRARDVAPRSSGFRSRAARLTSARAASGFDSDKVGALGFGVRRARCILTLCSGSSG